MRLFEVAELSAETDVAKIPTETSAARLTTRLVLKRAARRVLGCGCFCTECSLRVECWVCAA